MAQIIFKLSEDLHKRFKTYCVVEGKSMTEVLVKAVEKIMREKK